MTQAQLEAIREKNFYEILNVGREATTDEIRDSYKEIAKLYHPDSNFYAEIIQDPLTAAEEEIFKYITLAYTTLTNTDKRKQYDDSLPKGLRGWEDEDTPWEHRKKESTPYNGAADDPALRSPGSIDLKRFKHPQPKGPEVPVKPKVPSRQNSPKTLLFLCIGLGIAFGLCVSICILLFSQAL